MLRKVFCFTVTSLLLVLMAASQAKEEYLDAFIVKVKPDKRADFDAAAKKAAEANRSNNGDRWIAMETIYGDGDTITFISTRQGYADIEKGTAAFGQSLNKALGEAGAKKLFQDFGSSLVSSRGEIRRRRWDLSANAPGDAAGRAKIVGQARFLRTTIVHVRPGHLLEYEDVVKNVKAAAEKANPPQTIYVSQAVAGNQGLVFYITSLQKSLADFDNVQPVRQLLGEDGFRNLQKASAEHVLSSETVINRFLPELSNPPDEVASVAPDFWKPKATPAATRKPQTPKPQ
jgi:hypothetical protein